MCTHRVSGWQRLQLRTCTLYATHCSTATSSNCWRQASYMQTPIQVSGCAGACAYVLCVCARVHVCVCVCVCVRVRVRVCVRDCDFSAGASKKDKHPTCRPLFGYAMHVCVLSDFPSTLPAPLTVNKPLTLTHTHTHIYIYYIYIYIYIYKHTYKHSLIHTHTHSQGT